MKNAKKIMLLVLCAALLVGATVAGTVAYLTDNKTVTNTFTVGKVEIDMDEAKTDEYGVKDGDTRVTTGNAYLLVPGHTYVKDPTIYVKDNSEACYVFVKIDNGIAAYIESLDTQLASNTWTKLTGVDGVDNVWYKECTKSEEGHTLNVFGSFTVLDNANNIAGWENIAPTANDIVVTAYAIQKDSMGDAADAWTKLNNQLNP